MQNMSRVKDPEERKKLQDKSRRIFLRIAGISTLTFLGGLLATVMLMPQLTAVEDDEKGPCPIGPGAGDAPSDLLLPCPSRR